MYRLCWSGTERFQSFRSCWQRLRSHKKYIKELYISPRDVSSKTWLPMNQSRSSTTYSLRDCQSQMLAMIFSNESTKPKKQLFRTQLSVSVDRGALVYQSILSTDSGCSNGVVSDFSIFGR